MFFCIFYEHIKTLAAENNWPVEKAMQFVKENGIQAIDVSYREVQENPAAFRKKAEDNGLKIASVYGIVKFRSSADLNNGRKFIDDVFKTGAPNAMILPDILRPDEKREDVLPVLSRALEELALYAQEKGISLTLENYSLSNRPYSFISDFDFIFEHAPHMRMTLDMGNFAIHNENPVQAVCRFKDQITHVHVKNWGEEEACKGKVRHVEHLDGSDFYAYPAVAGGLVDIKSVLKELKKIHYKGALSIEIFGVFPMQDGIEKSAAFIKACLQENE